MADEPVVLYEERDSLAIITLNRPEKMNTLTDAVIQGIADGIDEATASPDVSSVILRGAGPTLHGRLRPEPRRERPRPGPQRPRYGAAHVDAPRRRMGPGPRLRLHGPQHEALHEALGMPEAGHRRSSTAMPSAAGQTCSSAPT